MRLVSTLSSQHKTAMIMDELLQRLEKRVKDLIDQHHELRSSNHELHSGKRNLVREREILIARQEKAINHIKNLVARLKAIESAL